MTRDPVNVISKPTRHWRLTTKRGSQQISGSTTFQAYAGMMLHANVRNLDSSPRIVNHGAGPRPGSGAF
jgi:hypothetical protein